MLSRNNVKSKASKAILVLSIFLNEVFFMRFHLTLALDQTSGRFLLGPKASQGFGSVLVFLHLHIFGVAIGDWSVWNSRSMIGR